jgi:hypothetical protein
VDLLKVKIWGRSATTIVVIEYCSFFLVVETLSLMRYPWIRCTLLVLCCCFHWMVLSGSISCYYCNKGLSVGSSMDFWNNSI